MSRSSAVSAFIAASGSRRKSSRCSFCVSECRKRLRRSPFALRSRSKTYLAINGDSHHLFEKRHRHRGRHRQVVVVMALARALIQRAAHDEPHDDLRALVAAEAHEVVDRHAREALRIAIDELEELAIP